MDNHMSEDEYYAHEYGTNEHEGEEELCICEHVDPEELMHEYFHKFQDTHCPDCLAELIQSFFDDAYQLGFRSGLRSVNELTRDFLLDMKYGE